MTALFSLDDLAKEFLFSVSRSSGPGGQHVNKVSTKVTLKFDVNGSTVLTHDQKSLILQKLRSSLTKDGCIVLSAQEKRSQLANKEAVVNKLESMLTRALTPRKTRKATKPTKRSNEKRITEKKRDSEKKARRRESF